MIGTVCSRSKRIDQVIEKNNSMNEFVYENDPGDKDDSASNNTSQDSTSLGPSEIPTRFAYS